jgi:hypothetical protein
LCGCIPTPVLRPRRFAREREVFEPETVSVISAASVVGAMRLRAYLTPE